MRRVSRIGISWRRRGAFLGFCAATLAAGGAAARGMPHDGGAAVAGPLAEPAVVELFVPVVVSTAGKPPAFYTTELTISNRGAATAELELLYTPALEGGAPSTVTDTLGPGLQAVHPDAIEYLRSLGAAIPPGGSRGGTLVVRARGIASAAELAVTLRTTTEVPEGRAGLAYSGFPRSSALTGPAYVFGLRQNTEDRSNLAVQNAGDTQPITLRATVVSGDPARPGQTVLPDVVLPPGGFFQWNEVLKLLSEDTTNGYAKVERVAGGSPYHAYGVVNDQRNSDGSYVAAVPVGLYRGRKLLILPAAVEAGSFLTEVILANTDPARTRDLILEFVSDAIPATEATAGVAVHLEPREQLVIPDFVQFLRDHGAGGIGPRGSATFVGAVFITAGNGTEDAEGLLAGARVLSVTPPPIAGQLAATGGRFGLFTPATAKGLNFDSGAWVYGLRQDAENRSNLALVNIAENDLGDDVFRIDVFDGETGRLAGTLDNVTVGPQRFVQKNGILALVAPGTRHGYAHITRTSGNNPFYAYAALNDGSGPGERTGDGAFLAASRECDVSVQPAGKSASWSGGSGTFGVVAPGACAWTAVSDAPWLKVSGGPAHTGSATVAYTVDPNPDATPRVGTITVGGHTYTVSQIANAPSPYDGSWTGTTSQARAIAFTIERGELTFFSVDLDVTLAPCRVNAVLSAAIFSSRPVVDDARLTGQVTVVSPANSGAIVNVDGTFASPNAISGTLQIPIVITDRGAFCSGSATLAFDAARP